MIVIRDSDVSNKYMLELLCSLSFDGNAFGENNSADRDKNHH